MSLPAVIVDTNVVVAGLLTSDAQSPVARIMDGMLSARFPFVLSESLLAEYRDVLHRPRLRKLHSLTAAEIDELLIDIAHNAIVLVPSAGSPAPDPGDQLLWDLLAARSDLILVTGDKALQGANPDGLRVVSPAQFVAGIPAP